VHRFGAKQVGWIQVNGDLAYVQLMDANTGTGEGYAVLDLRSGRVPHNGTGDPPELLVQDRGKRFSRVAGTRVPGATGERRSSAPRGIPSRSRHQGL
jgi:hypothetical protein